MDEALRRALLADWDECPDDERFPPATEDQLRQFESEFGPIPTVFRQYLSICGGGLVGGGAECVDGIERLSVTHRRFGQEVLLGYWKLMSDVFVIGWDGCGNPYGIHRETGRLLVEDHTFGGIHEMAASFEGFLRKNLRIS